MKKIKQVSIQPYLVDVSDPSYKAREAQRQARWIKENEENKNRQDYNPSVTN